MLPKWDLDAERDALEFHAGYCGRLLEKALEEVTFVLLRDLHIDCRPAGRYLFVN